jgi:hypothetical protein
MPLATSVWLDCAHVSTIAPRPPIVQIGTTLTCLLLTLSLHPYYSHIWIRIVPRLSARLVFLTHRPLKVMRQCSFETPEIIWHHNLEYSNFSRTLLWETWILHDWISFSHEAKCTAMSHRTHKFYSVSDTTLPHLSVPVWQLLGSQFLRTVVNRWTRMLGKNHSLHAMQGWPK